MFLLFTTWEDVSVLEVSFGTSIGTPGERRVLSEVSRMAGQKLSVAGATFAIGQSKDCQKVEEDESSENPGTAFGPGCGHS